MTDRRVFFAVVAFLGGTLLLTVVAIGVLAGLERAVPGILENIAVGCLTGLAGLLARGPSGEPQEVTIRQPLSRPVPVEEAPADAGLTLVEAALLVLFVLVLLLLLGAIPTFR